MAYNSCVKNNNTQVDYTAYGAGNANKHRNFNPVRRTGQITQCYHGGDEFQASYRAALDTPNLTDEERIMLMLDAFERARNANVPAKLNSVARRMIYGNE